MASCLTRRPTVAALLAETPRSRSNPDMRTLRLVLVSGLVVGAVGCDDGTTTTGTGGSTATSGATTSTTASTSSGTTSSTSSSASTGTGMQLEQIHRQGRFDDAGAFTWPGTSVGTRIDGGAVSVTLDGAGGVFFEIVVDGAPVGQFTTDGGSQTYPLAAGLAAGEHDVEIVRRNEGFFGAVKFVAFEPGNGTTLVQSPNPYAHRLEFIGDSLTAGYGIEGAPGCSFSGDTESAYPTYAMVAARAVKASAHLVAYSGKGVFQNYGGDKNELMPELWLRTLTDDPTPWDFSKYTPEVVVINLGTNDFSAAVSEAEFEGAYVELLGDVRSKYPAAHILAVHWSNWGATHEGWVTTALATFGDANTDHIQFTIDPNDGFGCDYHTNVVTNAKLGALLTARLKMTQGW